MICLDFLRLVWPAGGNYCVMTQRPDLKAKDGMARRHYIFDDIKDAYHHGMVEKTTADVYFGIHTHIDARVWDAKNNYWRVSRKRENMKEARCYMLDFDIGKSEPGKPKYKSQEQARVALAQFIFRTGLPWPFVVSSGNGLHCYWPFTDTVDSATWRTHAMNLRMLLDHHKMLYDPSRTVDTTSVLRMPATFNHKDPDDLKPTKVLVEGDVTDTTVLNDQLAALTKGMQPIKLPSASMPATNAYVNIVPNTLGFPITEVDNVAEVCEQVRLVRDLKGCVPEPHWYAWLGVMAYLNNGDAIAHQWSAGYTGYSFDETQSKMDQWRSRASVTGCSKFATDGALGVCQKCPHFGGQYKNPIVIANKAPVAVVAQFVQPQTVSAAIPGALCDPPWPYRRIASLGVEKENDKGKWAPILPAYDLYPVSVSAGIVLGLKVNQGVSLWVVREQTSVGIRSTLVDMPTNGLSDPKVAAASFHPHNIFIPFNAEVLKYMSAYLQALKAAQGERQQNTHLGWPSQKDQSKFIMNGVEIDAQGNSTRCVMSSEVDIITMAMTKSGTLAQQLQTLAFYNHPNYRTFQFYILMSLCSPLFMATGHHGVVVHMNGPSGSGKSMAMKVAAAIWGDPTHFIANGTDQGMTANARNKRAIAIPNLPQCIDEITHALSEDMRAMVMAGTQGTPKITLTPGRQVREHPTGFKSSPSLTNGNTSLHEIVNKEDARAGTANSARIIELISSYDLIVHTKDQGDHQLREVLGNYGWLGEEFIKLCMPNIAAHFKLVNAIERYLNRRVNAQFHERFAISAAAAALAAGVLARHFGFITWDIEALCDWFVDTQLPRYRWQMGRVAITVSPENVMREFIDANAVDTITVDKSANIIHPLHVRNQVVIHHAIDTKEFWINMHVFRAWCNKRGLNVTEILETLVTQGVVTQTDVRKILGEGSLWGRTRTICFVVDAKHPAII